jgi:hypothetical protein
LESHSLPSSDNKLSVSPAELIFFKFDAPSCRKNGATKGKAPYAGCKAKNGYFFIQKTAREITIYSELQYPIMLIPMHISSKRVRAVLDSIADTS